MSVPIFRFRKEEGIGGISAFYQTWNGDGQFKFAISDVHDFLQG